MLVSELIQHLSTFNQKLRVGCIGHYGKFHELNESNFSVALALSEAVNWDRHSGPYSEFLVLEVNQLNIGPEPD